MLEPFLRKSAFSHHGQRVVEGQQLTQAASDIVLGWVRTTDVEGVDRSLASCSQSGSGSKGIWPDGVASRP